MRMEKFDLPYERFLDSFGQKNDRILKGWLGDDTPDERIRAIGDAKEALYREFARREGLTPLPGGIVWVQRLRREGWHQAIASSAPRANVDVMLEAVGIAAEIDAVVSAEDVRAGKPDPRYSLRRPSDSAFRPSAASLWKTPPPGSRRRSGPACVPSV